LPIHDQKVRLPRCGWNQFFHNGPMSVMCKEMAAKRGMAKGGTSVTKMDSAQSVSNGSGPPRLLGEVVDLDPVRQESGLHLHWQGRRSYRSAVPTPRVLEPDTKLSFGDRDAGNLIIEGDNLQVMVSLQSQFADAIDVVYIDPPYNRGGKDFRYSDARFEDPNADGFDAQYVSNEDGGRHTKWLNYMAPRLVAIHRLMAEHAVIFASISDIELGRFLMVMDEIFDERNRIGVITWKGSPDNNPSRVAIEHEYILVYVKNAKRVPKVWTTPNDETREALLEHYRKLRRSTSDFAELKRMWARFVKANKASVERLGRYTDLDPERGPYQVAYRVHNPKPGGYRYGVWEKGILKETDKRSYTMPLNGYRFRPETMEQMIADGLIVFPRSRDQIVQMKDFLDDYRGTLRSVIELDARAGAYRLKQLFGQDFEGFKNPKPVELIEMLVGAAGSKDSIVFDPFAGSGTTGDAVLQLNRRDGGGRRFILIEEGAGADDYAKTLTAPRMRKVIELEGLHTGFTFMKTGRELDREAILGLEREKIIAVICQTDRTGAGSGIRRVTSDQWVIGANQRGEAIALVWNGNTQSRVTAQIINQALAEAKKLDLKTPLRIYGTTCAVSETRSFRFCQIPDEILASLVGSGPGDAAGLPSEAIVAT
jgi:adenine-specific DNA-methyltransferase